MGLIWPTWLTSWRKRWKYKFFSMTCSDVFFPVCVPPTLFKCFVVPWHDNERFITWCGVTLPRKSWKLKKKAERYWIEWEFNLTCAFKWISWHSFIMLVTDNLTTDRTLSLACGLLSVKFSEKLQCKQDVQMWKVWAITSFFFSFFT